MLIRQEESTPIGDFFHDSNICPLFAKIEGTVDEFEVDTDKLVFDIDLLVSKLKLLKTRIQTVTKDFIKMEHQREMKDKFNVD